MEHSFSPSVFGTLVNDSVTAVNNNDVASAATDSATSANQQPQKISFYDSDTSDNTLDELDDLDDSLGDLDDSLEELDDSLEELDDSLGELNDSLEELDDDQGESANTQQTNENADLPADLETRVLEQDLNSKIPNYAINVNIAVESNATTFDSLMQEVLSKFQSAYLNTNNCSTYLDLWNKNFVSMRLPARSEHLALKNILAMLYHLDFKQATEMQCLNTILQNDDAKLIHKLQQINRSLSAQDLEDPDTSIAVSITELNEEAGNMKKSLSVSKTTDSDESSSEQQTIVHEETLIETQPDEAVQEQQTKKLTKRQKIDLFVDLVYSKLLSESGRHVIESIPSMKESCQTVIDLFRSSKIAGQEFIKFIVYLACTKSVNLDKAILQEVRTFNEYVIAVVGRCTKTKIRFYDFSDGYVLVNPITGDGYEMFLSDLLFDWPVTRDSFTQNTKIIIDEDKGKAFLRITDADLFGDYAKIQEREIQYKQLDSNLTLMAKHFIKDATDYFDQHNSFEGFECNYTSEDLRFFRHKLLGYAVPENYKILLKKPTASLSVLLAYIETSQPDFIPYAFSGNIISARIFAPCNLSSNPISAAYQILAFDLYLYLCDTDTKVKIKLKQSFLAEPKIILGSDSAVDQAVTLTVPQYLAAHDSLINYIKQNSTVEISVSDFGDLKINLIK